MTHDNGCDSTMSLLNVSSGVSPARDSLGGFFSPVAYKSKGRIFVKEMGKKNTEKGADNLCKEILN